VCEKGESEMKVNPVNMIISMIVGWFVVSFLQAVGVAFFTGEWPNLISHFKQISFFEDGMGILINAIVIVVCGTVGTVIYIRMNRSGR
jgi:hypothetical protein